MVALRPAGHTASALRRCDWRAVVGAAGLALLLVVSSSQSGFGETAEVPGGSPAPAVTPEEGSAGGLR